eukprot:NODE_4329_length_813_cov_51.116492_g3586_i0.p2 GENE.NODE_4329_length_813_cov_51.116492_g3586_i0~~NODE_4329_length_813_cov_51.116492_g3586_i0.p2  ORF type:complete len:198 (+),score=64.62 NODE_4329_length_813_cov_51.116492_g3586_i0:97-690(+)
MASSHFLLASLLLLSVLSPLLWAAELEEPEDDTPNLLIWKKLDSEDLVVGQNTTVSLTIYNRGKSAAYNVKVEDGSWVAAQVSIAGGDSRAEFESIQGYSNVTMSYSITPLAEGAVMAEPATIKYSLTQEGSDARVTKSNTLPGLAALSGQEYIRRHARHYKEMFFFALLSIIPLGVPGFLYISNKRMLDAAYLAQK